MQTGSYSRLATASVAAHSADQLMLAMLPLWLTASGSGAVVISAVVAAQAAAWLLVSLPVGAFADRIARPAIMVAGAVAILLGGLAGAAALAAGQPSPWLIAGIAFVTASGVVAIVLAVFAMLPGTVVPAGLATANARIELGRAVACILAPLLAAWLVGRDAGDLGFALVAGAGAIVLLALRRLPAETAVAPTGLSLASSIREGAVFVIREPVLRAIALCAIAWNSAFFALTALLAPYAVNVLGLELAEIGAAWSVYGAGLVLGALSAPRMIAGLPTGAMFLFGPLLSCLGVLAMVLYAGPATPWLLHVALFCLGFGPMTWLVLQTSVRQLVTPRPLLGRVGATLTTAIYGVRPFGALAAGALASGLGLQAALWLPAALFALSALAMAASPAGRMRRMPVAMAR